MVFDVGSWSAGFANVEGLVWSRWFRVLNLEGKLRRNSCTLRTLIVSYLRTVSFCGSFRENSFKREVGRMFYFIDKKFMCKLI